MPLVVLMYVLNYIDRVNISFAKESLETDAGISTAAYGLGAGLFFIAYAVLEVPSNMLLERFGAKAWLTRIMISWGVVSACMMFVQGPTSFYILRLLLGATEAGFFAGVIFYFVQWFPRSHLARANGWLFTGSIISTIIAGPLSGLLLGMHGFAGLRGWQWMFLIEGIASVIVGLVIWCFLVSKPQDATWLTAEEKSALLTQLEAEKADRAVDSEAKTSRWKMLADPQILLFCFIYFAAQLAIYSVTFWLPTIIRGFGGLTDWEVGLLSAVPYIFAAVAIYIAGRASDRTGWRKAVLASGFVVAAIGTAMMTMNAPVLALIALILAACGFKVAASSFYVIPQSYFPAAVSATGIALINSIGNLGGFAAPTMLGYVQNATGDVGRAFLVVSGFCVLAALGVGLTRYRRKDAVAPTRSTATIPAEPDPTASGR
ncbi:MFS transporter [Nocardia carnea]|uniref:MFS transporter n=1 Tax=Nocardia carnea TaxID=37328 RepID=UPI00245604A5|nr:MFS transporter [Nocardia carnea]